MNSLQIAYTPIAYLLMVGLPIIYFDLTQLRIPNKLVLPALAGSLLTTLIIPFLTGDWLVALLTIVIAFAVGAGLVAMSMAERIGMGDVKLIITMGITLSPLALMNWVYLLVGIVLASLLTIAVKYLLHISHIVRMSQPRMALAPVIYLAYTALVIISVYTN
jgi:Flp pilus assembly protein protease CpaA